MLWRSCDKGPSIAMVKGDGAVAQEVSAVCGFELRGKRNGMRLQNLSPTGLVLQQGSYPMRNGPLSP